MVSLEELARHQTTCGAHSGLPCSCTTAPEIVGPLMEQTIAELSRRPLVADDTCPACPLEVRGLYDTAHNAVVAIEAAVRGEGDWERAHRKVAELKQAVEKMAPIVERHFDNLEHYMGAPH